MASLKTAAAGGVFRARIRPACWAIPIGRPAHSLRTTMSEARDKTRAGPAQQAWPGSGPSGAEIAKKNWVPLTGLAVAAVATYAYMARVPESTQQPETRASKPTDMGGISSPSSEPMMKQAMGADAKSLREISGRGKTGMAGFRSE